MTKVHPSLIYSAARSAAAERLKKPSAAAEPAAEISNSATTLTVWSKSLLFNCSGFTVFDAAGNLLFRVDNYLAGSKAEIVLMDAFGKPLFTIRRKRSLSLGDNWQIFDGETSTSPRFTVRKHVSVLNARCLAHVTSGGGGGGGSPRFGRSSSSSSSSSLSPVYEIEGSYAQRSCAVYDEKRRRVAEIRRKEAAVGGVALGGDVFRLLVEPQLDTALAMAFVILLDQMFGSSSRR